MKSYRDGLLSKNDEGTMALSGVGADRKQKENELKQAKIIQLGRKNTNV